MKRVKDERVRLQVIAFKRRGMQVPLDRNTYQDADLICLTAQPKATMQWDDPVLRQRIAR